MKIKILIFICTVFTVASFSQVYGQEYQDTQETTTRIEAEGAEKIELTVDFGAGSIDLKTADMDDLAIIEVYFTPRLIRYDVDYTKRGSTGYLSLESSLRRKKMLDESENEWTVILSKRYPISIDFDLGACEARLDLGGMPITSFNMDIGAASGVINFSEKNPVTLKHFEIDAGASAIEFENLANANFKYFELTIGAASCEIDLGQELFREAEIDLEVGVGSVDFYIPKDQAVRVEGDDGWFSSLEFHGLNLDKKRSGVWESDGFKQADNKLYINVSVAMGSVDFYSRR